MQDDLLDYSFSLFHSVMERVTISQHIFSSLTMQFMPSAKVCGLISGCMVSCDVLFMTVFVSMSVLPSISASMVTCIHASTHLSYHFYIHHFRLLVSVVHVDVRVSFLCVLFATLGCGCLCCCIALLCCLGLFLPLFF